MERLPLLFAARTLLCAATRPRGGSATAAAFGGRSFLLRFPSCPSHICMPGTLQFHLRAPSASASAVTRRGRFRGGSRDTKGRSRNGDANGCGRGQVTSFKASKEFFDKVDAEDKEFMPFEVSSRGF